MKALFKYTLIIGVTLLYSCRTGSDAPFEKVLVLKGNKVFNSQAIAPHNIPAPEDSLMIQGTTVSTVRRSYISTISMTDNYLTISKTPQAALEDAKANHPKWKRLNRRTVTTTGFCSKINSQTLNELIVRKKTYFMHFDDPTIDCAKTEITVPNRHGFYYMDIKPVFQTLTIPFKFRPQEYSSSQGIHDTTLATYQTSVNVGFAGGFKFTLNKYVPKKNFFGTNTLKISLIPGLLLGISGTDLKAETTFPKVTKSRTALSVTTGGYVMIGINSINFGYATGFDFATGENRNKWIYQGRNWHGIIVAIDLIK